MKKGVLIGFLINDEVFYSIAHREISRTRKYQKEIKLRHTMARFLEYLLKNGKGKLVTDKQIMIHIWDRYGLRYSPQRQWQVFNGLKTKLDTFSLSETLIKRVRGEGYYIPHGLVVEVYSVSNDIDYLERWDKDNQSNIMTF